MTNRPLLSIVIATKNRELYCIETIKSILKINNGKIQIAISDNSDTEQVKTFIKKIAYKSIAYIYDKGPLSSIDNFNRAMSLATGEYVCLLGDDDGLLPDAIETIKWAKKNNVDSISPINTIAYYWPGALKEYPDGFMVIPSFESKIEEVDAKKELNNLLKAGLQNYLEYSLPKSYHGFIKKTLMEEIKKQTGNYYGGLSPDIYSAVSLSLIVKKHFITTKPLTIAGVCKSSTTAANFTGGHSGTLESMPHLKNRTGYIWSTLVPRFYSTNTIWAESAIKAIQDMNYPNLLSKFNSHYLIAKAIINNYKFIPKILKKETIAFRKKESQNIVKFWGLVFFNALVILFRKVIYNISNENSNKKFSKNNVTDIHECIHFSNIHITNTK